MNSMLAIIFGLLFGFILQRVGALDYKNILNTLRLIDLMIAKFMFLAVGITVVGVFTLRSMGLIFLEVINFNIIGTLAGGLIFGAGFAVSGYCPGTCIGAWGEGKKDASYVVLGGIFGVLAYTLIQGSLAPFLMKFNVGEVTLLDYFPINSVALAAIYAVAIGLTLYIVDKIEVSLKERKTSGQNKPLAGSSTAK